MIRGGRPQRLKLPHGGKRGKVLLVNASARPSELHGIGLIAREFIPCGTQIWIINPDFDRLLSEEEFQALSPVAQQQVKHYAYFCNTQRKYVLSADDDRFTNHSENPNTEGMRRVFNCR